MICLSSLVLLSNLPLLAQDRNPVIQEQESHDPPVAAIELPTEVSPAATFTFRGFRITQVNVNSGGQNIVGDAANEPSMAIDPTNPKRIAAGWRQFDSVNSDFRQAGYGFSTTGGASWTFPGRLNQGIFRSDPVLEATTSGQIVYHSLTGNFLCDTFVSNDGGQTYAAPIPAFGGDKAWTVIDRTNSTGRDFLYASWSPNAGCCGGRIFTRSTNRGQSWSNPISLPLTPMFGTVDVGPDGEVYVGGIENNNFGSFVVVRSDNAKNGSQTPTFPIQARANMGGAMGFSAGPNPGGLLGQAWVAVDRSSGPRRGWAYLLCSVDPSGADPLDVRIARSRDGGRTWDASVRVNDDPTGSGRWQWFGTLGVAPDGRLDAVWYDTRNDTTVNRSAMYYSFSLDGGATWSKNIQITPEFSHFVGYPRQSKLGDYIDIQSDRDGVRVLFAATFNNEQDVYFVRIPIVVAQNAIRKLRQ